MALKDEEERREYDRNRYKNNPIRKEQCKKRAKTWKKKNREQVLEYQREYHRKKNSTPEGKLELRKRVLKKHGLSLDDFAWMLQEQMGVCAICGQNETVKDRWGNVRRLDVDHNHITNKNRGLLCQSCNTALGKLRADEGIDLFIEAIKYIRRYENAFNEPS